MGTERHFPLQGSDMSSDNEPTDRIKDWKSTLSGTVYLSDVLRRTDLLESQT